MDQFFAHWSKDELGMLVMALSFSLLIAILTILGCSLDFRKLQKREKKTKQEIKRLQQELSILRLIPKNSLSPPPVMVIQAKGGDALNEMSNQERPLERQTKPVEEKNFPEKASQQNFPSTQLGQQGDKTMAKVQQNKSLVREIGFFRMVIMFGLFAALSNMVAESWRRIKNNFKDEEEDKQD